MTYEIVGKTSGRCILSPATCVFAYSSSGASVYFKSVSQEVLLVVPHMAQAVVLQKKTRMLVAIATAKALSAPPLPPTHSDCV